MTLEQFISKTRWTPNNGLDSADNYRGDDLSQWCQGPGRNRDSEILQESNFDAALEMLGGEVEGIVEVHRFGHWACGWFEVILVNPSDLKAIQTLMDIHKALEHYPVLDDSDYYERESEYQSEYAEQAQDALAAALDLHFNVGMSESLVNVAYNLNLEAQRYYGNDACVNIYTCREPDDRNLKKLQTVLEQMDYFGADDSLEASIVEYLMACLGEVDSE
jgi:hypothetical protein